MSITLAYINSVCSLCHQGVRCRFQVLYYL